MLHCPPSRIHLTSSDITDFDRRFAARQSGHYVPLKTAGMRLGSAVGHLTKASIVPAHRNIGRARADSCSSEAKLCIDESTPTHSSSIPTIVTSAASPFGNVAHRRTTSSPRHLSALDQGGYRGTPNSSPRGHHPEITSQFSRSPVSRPGPSPSLPHIPERITSLSNEHGVPLGPSLRQKPVRPSSIPRPRRHPSQQASVAVYEQTPALNELHERLQTAKAGPRTWDGRRLRSMNDDEHEWAALAGTSSASTFDPGAAVFVPRTRFGSTTTASVEGSTRHLPDNNLTESRDSLEAGVNLRLRSSFERNSQYHRHLDSRTSMASRNASVYAPRSVATQARRRSRTYEQNNTRPSSVSVSERHSSIRAPPTSFAARRGSGSQRPVIFPRRDSSRRNLATFERSRRVSGAASGISAASSLSASLLNIPKDIDSGRQMPRSISPALSTSSRSTPNLLRSPPHLTSEVHTRSNSFTWSQTGQREVETATISMRYISLAEHDEMPQVNPDLLDVQPGSALDRLLNCQHSPLDELTQHLTQQLSRMNSGRPRSVGRSFERPPGTRPRISLLNGDPFRQDSSPERPSSSDTHDGYQTHYPPPSSSKKRDSILSTLSTDEDPVALSLALPSPAMPSPHQTASSPIQLPSTPATALREKAVSPRSSKSISSPVRGSEWMSSGTPPTRPTVTPRMTVYNDSRPAELQPQTPADIARSTARRRARAGTASSRASNTYNSGSPAVPSSSTTSSNRHTYPAATPPQPEVVTPARMQVPSTGGRRVSMAARVEEGVDENDVDEALDILEEDRRVWMGRREGGALDTTPPAEGRFERFLEGE